MWQRVSDGMEDYGADLRAMALNAKLRQASFATQHGKNRMTLLSSIVDGILNANNAVPYLLRILCGFHQREGSN
jgi:hypothetical protein